MKSVSPAFTDAPGDTVIFNMVPGIGAGIVPGGRADDGDGDGDGDVDCGDWTEGVRCPGDIEWGGVCAGADDVYVSRFSSIRAS